MNRHCRTIQWLQRSVVVMVFLASASAASAFGLRSTIPLSSSSRSSLVMVRSRCDSILSKPTLSAVLPSRFRSNSHLSASIETNDEVKDPDTLISAQDDRTQQLSFIVVCSGIFSGSIAFIYLYNFLEGVLPSSIFDPFYTILPCVLSSAFIAAGIAHFALEDTFTSFVPPKGSWGGLWQVPSPGSEQLGLTYEQYHSFWSGIAEVIVGISLFLTTLASNGVLSFGDAAGGNSAFFSAISATTIPAALMYCLTAAVTPANIYMYTHNPVVPRIPALPYPWGHGARGLLQCALLAVFYKLTVHSIV